MAYTKLVDKGNGYINVTTTLTSFEYGNVTHQTRKDRNGIQEALWVVESQYRINNGAWVKKGTAGNYDVAVNKGDKLEVWTHYRYDTQGYHHKNSDLPFFYYTDQEGNVANYSGYTTNGKCPWPSHIGVTGARQCCKLPTNWTPLNGGISNVSIVWTDWAKVDATTDEKNLWWHSGPQHEQRNANASKYKDYSYGWYSSQGKWNYYRRSCMWKWECKETVSIIGTGKPVVTPPTPSPLPPAQTKPKDPTLVIYDAYGSNGKVNLKNNDSAACTMNFGAWLAEVGGGANVSNTWVWLLKDSTVHPGVSCYVNKWSAGESYTLTVDFDKVWGESYGGKDVYYQLSASNSVGESGYAPFAGHHHYNARPTVPTVTLDKSGKTMTGNWHSVDPDPRNYSTTNLPASTMLYDVNLEVNGVSKTLFTNTTSTSTTIQAEEGNNYVLKVRSYDGRIYSKSWGSSSQVQQGYDALKPDVVFPINNSTIYNTSPRIIIMTNSKAGGEEIIATVNGTTYNSKTNTNNFSKTTIPKGKAFVIFKPNNLSIGSNTISVKTQNSSSVSASYTTTIKVASLTLSLNSGQYITTEDYKVLDTPISNVRYAYGLSGFNSDGVESGYIEKEDVNLYTQHIIDMNNIICSYSSTLSPTIKSKNISSNNYIDSSIFNNIVSDLKNM